MPNVHNGGPEEPRVVARVPQELVHKHASTEVLLTDWTVHGGDRHTVHAVWPRHHSFYRSHNQRFDPLLFVETVRQTFPLLSHVAYGVPFDSHLVWDDFAFEVEAQAMLVPPARADVVLEVTCTDVRTRKNRLVSMTMHTEVRLNGCHVGRARTRFTNHSPAVYSRLRSGHGLAEALHRALPPPPPLRPVTVGHHHPENVVLAETGRPGRWQLRVDLDHAVLFDHPVDHVPGMFLLEAVRQAARADSSDADRTVTGMSVSFDGWVELDAPAWISVRRLRAGTLSAVVEQGQSTRLTAEVAVESVPIRAERHPADRGEAHPDLHRPAALHSSACP
ncbi:ScbA/BarX family gamma-butyrolactone biosynthesis protein [Streptomyces sp. NPDC012950]|uniref:ScbA/BarX family gamma-butyrolactone biosynthesis protein n=1 Tax=Streptomyces sp. NPDC012950 TaxID=3364858 RepID=UPI0036CDB9B9